MTDALKRTPMYDRHVALDGKIVPFAGFEMPVQYPTGITAEHKAVREAADPWMTAADFRSFVDAQQRANDAWGDRDAWTRMSILNSAASGRFSTDRTMRDYNDDIWHLEPIEPG